MWKLRECTGSFQNSCRKTKSTRKIGENFGRFSEQSRHWICMKIGGEEEDVLGNSCPPSDLKSDVKWPELMEFFRHQNLAGGRTSPTDLLGFQRRLRSIRLLDCTENWWEGSQHIQNSIEPLTLKICYVWRKIFSIESH